ncbi:hypothetical protein BASA83_006153 [Batrachochytrium salamandrivorans]|nr:hypothetical protein BASA83_006153 [Batrachochytrium salamandrivorans]
MIVVKSQMVFGELQTRETEQHGRPESTPTAERNPLYNGASCYALVSTPQNRPFEHQHYSPEPSASNIYTALPLDMTQDLVSIHSPEKPRYPSLSTIAPAFQSTELVIPSRNDEHMHYGITGSFYTDASSFGVSSYTLPIHCPSPRKAVSFDILEANLCCLTEHQSPDI